MYEWADDTHGPGPDSSGVWECAWEIEAGLPLQLIMIAINAVLEL
jgi:hypothetical protein